MKPKPKHDFTRKARRLRENEKNRLAIVSREDTMQHIPILNSPDFQPSMGEKAFEDRLRAECRR